MWSHDVISTSINLAGDLKMGQYLKIPPRAMFLTQIWGTILGAIVNYGEDIALERLRAHLRNLYSRHGLRRGCTARHPARPSWYERLEVSTVLDAEHVYDLTVLYSGQYPQSLNSAAVTWSLAKQLYGPHGPYIWIPLSLVFGMIPTFFQWLLAKVRNPLYSSMPPRRAHILYSATLPSPVCAPTASSSPSSTSTRSGCRRARTRP